MISNNRGRQVGRTSSWNINGPSVSHPEGWWDRWSWSRFTNNKVGFCPKNQVASKPSLVPQDCEGSQGGTKPSLCVRAHPACHRVVQKRTWSHQTIMMIWARKGRGNNKIRSESTTSFQNSWHVFGELRHLREIRRLLKTGETTQSLAILVCACLSWIIHQIFLWCSCG